GSHKPNGTIASSAREAVQLVNGSGEVLIAARVPALARCAPAANVPPRIAAASATAVPESPNTAAASAAPAGMRVKLGAASHTVSSPGSSIQPSAPARPTAKITA